MRVAFVNFHRGGMAHYAAMLTRSVAAADPSGRRACFCCEEVNPALFAAGTELRRFAVPQVLRWRSAVDFLRAGRTIRRLRREVGEWNPDLVHVNSGHVLYALLLPELAQRFPLVATLHDVQAHPGDGRLYKGLKLRPLIRHARKLLVHSECLRKQASRKWPAAAGRLAVVPCGLLLPTPRPSALLENPGQVLFVGRLRPYKGIDTLLRAWPEVVAGCPSARLTIAGAGRIGRWGAELPPNVRVVNRFLSDSELADFLNEAAVVVLPYIEASQSGVAVTAAAFGKPVVASCVGAIPEVVLDGETGALVKPGDPAALARALLRLLSDRDERLRMGQAARALGEERFGPAAIGRALLDVYAATRRGAARSEPIPFTSEVKP